jgi:hypothetical protein
MREDATIIIFFIRDPLFIIFSKVTLPSNVMEKQ